MKAILTASRHPDLDRPAFFQHLREVHWPLVRDLPSVIREVRRYDQNHTILPQDDGGVPTPWRRAGERDSVIEVVFDSFDGLQRMDTDADYMELVRPDEAYFNDLPTNVMLLAEDQLFHVAPQIGRVKRFDFLYRTADHTVATFTERCVNACRALALDPPFQALADRLSLHLPFPHVPQPPSPPDAVLSTLASGLDAMARLGAPRFTAGFQEAVDDTRSFSVLAVTFPIHSDVRA